MSASLLLFPQHLLTIGALNAEKSQCAVCAQLPTVQDFGQVNIPGGKE